MHTWLVTKFPIILITIVFLGLLGFQVSKVYAASVCTGSDDHYYHTAWCEIDREGNSVCKQSQNGVQENCAAHDLSCYITTNSGTYCSCVACGCLSPLETTTGGNCSWVCTPNWPDPLCDGLCGHLVDYCSYDTNCGQCHTCSATGACCTPNCACAANTCVGQTCSNGCGGSCAGTKPNNCGCAANTCVGQTCPGTCGDSCAGTKPNNCGCAANTCVGQTCIGTCGDVCPGTKVDESATACTGTQVQYTETPQTTGTIWAKATGCTWGVTSTSFPTWNSYNNQDDIVWYSGTNQGGGSWQSTINISSHQPALGPTVNVHVYENGVCRPIGSGWELVGGKTVTLAPKTCSVTINTPGAVSGQTGGINITATGNAHINPGNDTVRMWITRSDMGVIPGGVTYDYGGSTGIAAANNGSNYYALDNAYKSSVNAANTSATFTVHAPPGSYRVHYDLPTDLNGNFVKCSGNPNCTINGGSTTCTNWKSCSTTDWATFRINSPPTISNLVIRNSVGTAVAAEAGNRNHICQSSFASAM